MYKSHCVGAGKTQVIEVKIEHVPNREIWHKVNRLVGVCLWVEDDSLDRC